MLKQKIKSDYFQTLLKHLLIFFLPLSALVAAILTSYYYSETRAQRILTENRALYQVTLAKEIIASEYVSPVSDLYFISENYNFQKIFESGYNSEWTNRLVKDLLLILELRSVYGQIRIIDETGRERIKIINKNGKPLIVPEERLQSKKNRYYFKMAFALDKGKIYVSPFDLNIEDGEIERPLNPIIRFAMPLFDNQGKKRGILVLNYLGEDLQENVKALSSNDPGNIMIVNDKGFWLLGARTEDEWGFMLEERRNKIFGRSFPDAWKQITAANSESFSNAEGVFSFDTVHTLKIREQTGTPGSEISNRNHYLSKFEEKYWKIIYHVPLVIMKAKSSTLQKNLFFLFAIISAPLAVGTWFMAHVRVKYSRRRQQAEDELKSSEEQLRTVTSSVNEAIIMMDSEGLVSYWNPAAETIFGFSSGEVLDRDLSKFIIPEKYRDKHQKAVLSFKDTGQGAVIGKTVELEGLRKNGEEFPVELSLSSIKYKDNWHAIGILRDITKRKEAAKVLKRAKDKLEDKSEQLEKANRELKETTAQLVQSEKLSALGELTGGVAHELNQPLNVVKIICQSHLRDIAKNRFEKEEIEQDLPEIVDQINKMADIIDHMRVFSRKVDGEGSREIFDISEVVENSFKLIEQQLKNRNIEIVKELCRDLPKVSGDSIRIEQVILNLVSNARNALENSDRKGKRIAVKTCIVDGQKFVAVEVRDNGGGIPEHMKKRIFQPFFTSMEALAPDGKPTKGKGLGLSVANQIVEEHKGRIELESKVGEGATFRVVLPMAEG